MTPRVTVVMPVYNAERYVAEAVESILGQSFGDLELIAIDDGSTDGSRAILERIAAGDGRLRLISRPNTGYSVALNEGLALARGEFVARMDADDVALPRRLEVQIEHLRRNPECVAVGSRVLLIDADGAALCPFGDRLTHEEIDGAHLSDIGGSAIVHPSVTIRRGALKIVGGYRSELEPAEDVDLFLRLAEVGRLANLPEILLEYRRHASAVGYGRRWSQERAIRQAIRNARRRRGLVEEPEPVEDPAPEGSSAAEVHRTWAWWALGAGNVSTARKHALAALRLGPLAIHSWRAMYCALRGH